MTADIRGDVVRLLLDVDTSTVHRADSGAPESERAA